MTPDAQLLARYATERDEAAFAELVQRHLNHVYSTALRLVGGDGHLAEDVAQGVFTELAGKAGSLCDRLVLSGWLHTTTRFMAAKVVRSEQRRRQREQTALPMPSNSTASSEPDWDQVRALLDESIGELSDPDRDALMLRYFEKKPLAEVGAVLGVSEDAARMRVDRAVDKLRTRLVLRGITSTAVALTTVLAQNLVGSAPAALGSRITAQALAGAAVAGTTGWTWLPSKAVNLAIATSLVVIVGTIGLLKFRSSQSALRPATPQIARTAQAPLEQPSAMRAHLASAEVLLPNPVGLQLLFLDAQTGFPVTNQTADLKGWQRGAQLLVKKTVQLQEGRGTVPFEPDASPDFRIYTHLDGYANVHVHWDPKRGEPIPELYTVRLIRPVLIHGRVVDIAGNGIAGTTVGFNTEEVAGSGTITEDHTVDYLTAKTDADGYWEMNRLAPEMVRRLFGSASHPDYSRFDTPHSSQQPEFAQRLLDGTARFVLPDGIVVRGTVQDEAGQPVNSALVRVGQMNSSRSRETRTDRDGTFTVRGCQAGQGLVTVELEGYAPTARALTLSTNLPPVQLTLGVGRVLRVRVMDPSNNPIAGASVTLDSFPRGERLAPIPQVEFRRQTDVEGRMTWETAPDQDLEFSVSASGHLDLFSVRIHPDDEEHTVVLSPALIISGTVRDAVTHDSIPQFRIGIGWPEQGPDGSIEPRWSDIDRFWLKFTGGQFHHALEEMVIGGSTNRGYVFRFEADGHKPFVTRAYQADEGELVINVELQPGQDIPAMAYTPQGKPARNAQVAFVSPGTEVRLVPGGFAGDLGHALPWLRLAKADGGFTVPDDDNVQRVIVASPEGYAESSREELRQARAIRLAPWSRIEGVYQSGGKPVANAEIRLLWNSELLGLSFDAHSVRTDAEGRFAFPQVPPGSYQILVGDGESDANRQQFAPKAQVELRSNETKQVSLSEITAAQAQ
jgi:RNA polymerase sigma factor (sigma-70 family)